MLSICNSGGLLDVLNGEQRATQSLNTTHRGEEAGMVATIEPMGESGQKSLAFLTTFHLLGQHPSHSTASQR